MFSLIIFLKSSKDILPSLSISAVSTNICISSFVIVPKPNFSNIPFKTLVSTNPVSCGSYTLNASATGSKFLISLFSNKLLKSSNDNSDYSIIHLVKLKHEERK